jgi:hypothetical protein
MNINHLIQHGIVYITVGCFGSIGAYRFECNSLDEVKAQLSHERSKGFTANAEVVYRCKHFRIKESTNG